MITPKQHGISKYVTFQEIKEVHGEVAFEDCKDWLEGKIMPSIPHVPDAVYFEDYKQWYVGLTK